MHDVVYLSSCDIQIMLLMDLSMHCLATQQLARSFQFFPYSAYNVLDTNIVVVVVYIEES